MPLFRKNRDLVTVRAKALNREIADLEDQIKKLNDALAQSPPPPRLRPATLPHGPTPADPVTAVPAPAPVPSLDAEPVFEAVDQARLKEPASPGETTAHFNERGLRKFDLAAVWQRFRTWLKGPSTSNPKLVNYLAAGSIHGLQPLRYEKRVARNRFILLVICFLAVLWGLLAVLLKTR